MTDSTEMMIVPENDLNLFKERCLFTREEMQNNPYIIETFRVLPVGGFRSAIGSFWNAVVDDLRKKILYRSIKLFNKEMKPSKEVKCYEDFQDNVSDEMLIDGAYKIGVIGWEAHKVLKQAKTTRHIFDGHPQSSEPTPIKTLSMMEDCMKYVLNQDYPPEVIDIDDYIDTMGTEDFYRDEYSVSYAVDDLPDIYKNELINRFFSAYIHEATSSILRSNIEFVAPILWRILPKEVMLQVTKRVDQEIQKGNVNAIEYAFSFVDVVGAKKYLSTAARRIYLAPIIERLNENLDTFAVENECVRKLSRYAGYIPQDLLSDYVNGITQTYIGHVGGSAYYSRTDFYANGAALLIPDMFSTFDDKSVDMFVNVIKKNKVIKARIRNKTKLNRLRNLGNIAIDRVSESYSDLTFLKTLVDETKEGAFFASIDK